MEIRHTDGKNHDKFKRLDWKQGVPQQEGIGKIHWGMNSDLRHLDVSIRPGKILCTLSRVLSQGKVRHHFYSLVVNLMRAHSRAFLSASPMIIIAIIIHHNCIVLCKLQSIVFGILQRQRPCRSPFNSLNLTWCLLHGRQSVNSQSINEKIKKSVASPNLSLIINPLGQGDQILLS